MNQLTLALLGLPLSVMAEQPTQPVPMAPPPPPPVVVAPSAPVPGEVTAVVVTNIVIVTNVVPVTSVVLVTNPIPQPQFVYEQKLMGGRAPLVTPEQARTLIEIFHTNYAKLGSPRFLIYVNRELVDENTGMKIAGRTEHTEHIKGQISGEGGPNGQTASVALPGGLTASGDIKISPTDPKAGQSGLAYDGQKAANDNTYKFQEAKELTVADRQAIRDIERVFARPLRMSGASFADQKVATQILAGKGIKDFVTPVEGEQARKDREALGKISDVVIEVLFSYKNATVTRVSGDQTYSIPNLHVTAIRLSDSKVLGQASSDDMLKGSATPYAYDMSEITEATALALMQDLLLSVP
jgi:hypothetical protein